MPAALPSAGARRKGGEWGLKGLSFTIPLCMQHTPGLDPVPCSTAGSAAGTPRCLRGYPSAWREPRPEAAEGHSPLAGLLSGHWRLSEP